MLRKVYPWLVPLIVAVLLVLSFVVAERVRSNTPEGKFNRIQLGMEREVVHRVFGERPYRFHGVPDDVWIRQEFTIQIAYDPQGKVSSKKLDSTILLPSPEKLADSP